MYGGVSNFLGKSYRIPSGVPENAKQPLQCTLIIPQLYRQGHLIRNSFLQVYLRTSFAINITLVRLNFLQFCFIK